MLVTGIQSGGSKGLTAVQGTVVDTEGGGIGPRRDRRRDRCRGRAAGPEAGDPQPVVFQRQGVDNRPLALRHEHAAARYRSDGGDHDHDEAA